jgi:orotate phosphoribosyltransferase
LHHLCTWWDVLEAAREGERFDAETLSEVENFLRAPRPWQEARKK